MLSKKNFFFTYELLTVVSDFFSGSHVNKVHDMRIAKFSHW